MRWITGCFALLLALSLGVLPTEAKAATYEGLDVSVWQGEIDFVQVRAFGKEVVYIRAGYGLSEDSRFRENAGKARAAGMKVGFYFYVTAADTAQARAQGAYFARLLREQTYECRPAVDFEQYGSLSKEELNAIALAFAQTLEEETGVVPVFYTNSSSAASVWEEGLTRYPLWIAEYGPSQPSSIGHWPAWAGFQYADNGRVPGIAGNVDLDRFTDGVLLEEPTGLPFEDVGAGDWFYPAVKDLYDRGLIQGVAPDRFAPGQTALRGEAVTLLYRLAGAPGVSGDTGFSDVPAGAWYASAVRWAEEAGIAQGVTPRQFAPLEGVSRQELAVFLWRDQTARGGAAGQRADLRGYTDEDQVAPWAREAVQWAVAQGILQGTGPAALDPQGTADRAQLAVMVQRYLEKEGIT